jgi:hypothetical protein
MTRPGQKKNGRGVAKSSTTKTTAAKKAAPPKPPTEWQIRQAKEKAERDAREAARKAEQAERVGRVVEAFDPEWLKWICEAHETHFEETFDLTKVEVDQAAPSNYYYYKDNGSNILAVAHLDTVIAHSQRMCDFVNTAAGPMVWSGSLDDRLGAYTILKLLPELGLEFDILLTVGEESGKSTAVFFDPPEDKQYLWGIEFDRGGTDVVMYDYDDAATAQLVRDCGARVGKGSFSDIAYLEHLEVKMFNWGVAYRDYHGPKGHAWLNETFDMVGWFLKFYDTHQYDYLPHEKKAFSARGRGRGGGSSAWGGGTTYSNGYWSSPYSSPPVDEGDRKVAEEYATAIGVSVDPADRSDGETWKDTLVGKGEWPAGWPAPVKEKINPWKEEGQGYRLEDGSERVAVGHQVLWRRAVWEKRCKADPEWSPAKYQTKEDWLSAENGKQLALYGGDCETCGMPVIEGICSERCDLPIFALYCEECGTRKVAGSCPKCDVDCPSCGWLLGGVLCIQECGTTAEKECGVCGWPLEGGECIDPECFGPDDPPMCPDCGYREGWATCKERCGIKGDESIAHAVIANPSAGDFAYLAALERNQRLLDRGE